MEFDLVIVGAGSGGYEACLYAHRRGLKVALVELSPETVGGNCLNRGCIPSKYMRHGAYLIEKLNHIKNYGVHPQGYTLDMKSLKENRDRVVVTIRENFKRFAEHIGIPIFYGRGILEDRNTVYVEGSDVKLKARFILLATGSSVASLGDLKSDGKYIHDTDSIWSLEEFPKRMLIVGGGAVGVEFAYIYRMYGVDVILVEIKDRILPSPDIPEDSARYLGRKLKKLGVDIRLKTSVQSCSVVDGKVYVNLSDGKQEVVDLVLLAVGRTPNTSYIGLEDIGVEKDQKGFVKVNSYCQTSVSSVYACGDITSQLMLAHKSMYEGKVAISHMLGETDLKKDDRWVPKIIYSAYEVASVGLTEEQAEDEGYDVKVGVVSYVTNPKAMDDGENEGFVRLVVDSDSGNILGCHIVGPNAGELIHQVVHVMRAGLKADFLSRSMYTHPSLSEAIGQAASEVHYGPISWSRRA
ncbi:dihydrolipoyl dehydrogenase [Thermocrinis minervae]|uniref:Dihydrolipoyl dehydrogenase n=1 Tax=Thermocrinis minervae TaxID=381751 RepID=A0A1M6RFM6_9AQUI|nr:dihydrolipoyl dehydrogenase [Thermocrinis minervae]SHK31262.1 dihydrolipoamide dehydrogenase [Thermocrinis minervae]